MAKVTLLPRAKFNKRVANLPEVKRAVDNAAREIGANASANLSAHRKEGDAEIHVDTSGVDALVYMTSPDETTKGGIAAAAIEFGHLAPDGSYVPGLYILTKASGLA